VTWLAPLAAHKDLGTRRSVIAGIGNTEAERVPRP
jgi:hypothetical protein